MRQLTVLLLFLLLALFSTMVNGVVISGTVVDSTFQPMKAIVELSSPTQVVATSNGAFSFVVEPNKNYTLTATSINSTFRETNEVRVGNQDVHFDIVLITPAGFESEVTDLNETLGELAQLETPLNALDDSNTPITWIIALLAIIIGIGVVYLYRTKPIGQKEIREAQPVAPTIQLPQITLPTSPTTVELDSFKVELLKLLKEKGGAVEQKELRRELPWSEARVSIEISELEKMGKLKKVKKGRANLVKLT